MWTIKFDIYLMGNHIVMTPRLVGGKQKKQKIRHLLSHDIYHLSSPLLWW